MLKVDNISLTYRSDNNLQALSNINFSVSKGELVALIGPSGCGKSSLLHIISGFITPTSGECYLNQKLITSPSSSLGILFQKHTLFPWKTVYQNVLYPLKKSELTKPEAKESAEKWLSEVGLLKFKDFYPNQLSGGMQQRATIARLYASEPDIFLMDEPFGSLDAYTKVSIQESFLNIWDKYEGTVLLVTHDIDEALLLADRILVMSARPGTIIDEISVPLQRPRRSDDLYQHQIIDIKKEIFSKLRQESDLLSKTL